MSIDTRQRQRTFAPEASPVALLDLASAIVRRWQRGERPDADAALAEHGELRAHSFILLDLAYQEYAARRKRGEEPDLDEYCRRFPEVADSLVEMIRLDQLAEAVPEVRAEFQAPRWPEPGESFRGFALICEIGRGGFGRVFLASEPLLGGRVVALKIGPHAAAEARTLGKLRHPNIVPVYSAQEDPESGLTALCMPYLGTATLEQVVEAVFRKPGLPERADVIVEAVQSGDLPAEAGGRFPPPPRVLRKGRYIDGVLHLTAQLADALEFVHSMGICHRDLKPSNVLVSPDGRPMLLDFDLSHDGQREHNRLGGTLPYMSPEQLLATDFGRCGDSPLLDGRSDLFSLGVILYKLLTGKHPFCPLENDEDDARLRARLIERQRESALPVRKLNPQLDPRLACLIDRCLAYNPNDRPQTAAELAAGLRQALTLPRRARCWAQRRPRLATCMVMAMLTIAVASGYAWSSRPPYCVRQYQAGLAAYREGDSQKALAHLHRAVDDNPTFAQALYLRGRVLLALGENDSSKYHQAKDDFARLLEIAPGGQIECCVAYCFELLNHPGAAISYYEMARASGYRSAAALNNLGHCYLLNNRSEDGIRVLTEALACDPGSPLLRWNRAFMYSQKLNQLCMRLNNTPRSGLGIVRRWALQAEWDRGFKCCRQDLEQAIDAGLADPEVHLDAAKLYAMAGEYHPQCLEEAMNHLRAALLLGLDAERVRASPVFQQLRSRADFNALLVSPPGSPPSLPRPSRVLNPVADELN